MLFSTVALLAVASVAAAEPVLIQMSAREIFGLLPRQGDGYSPTQTLCTGGGTTCQSACGPSFDQCASTDGNIVGDPGFGRDGENWQWGRNMG